VRASMLIVFLEAPCFEAANSISNGCECSQQQQQVRQTPCCYGTSIGQRQSPLVALEGQSDRLHRRLVADRRR